jgi:hypothetical protein
LDGRKAALDDKDSIVMSKRINAAILCLHWELANEVGIG